MSNFKVEVIDNKLGDRLQRVNFTSPLNRRIRKSIFILYWEALRRVPVDSWMLKSSHRKKFENLFWSLGANTDYAKYVHEGTIKQKAQPWLSESLKDKEKEILNILSRELDYTIKRI